MLASPSTAASNRTAIPIASLEGTHIFDLKLDGIRAFGMWDRSRFRLVNRNAVDITEKYPDVVNPATDHFARTMPDQVLVLDGEIVAKDGRFETVLTRDKQSNRFAIEQAARTKPVEFHAFDLPTTGTLDWITRRAALDSIDLPPGMHRTPWWFEASCMDHIRAKGLEGVIAKRITSRYEFGARSRSWIKFKNVHRITCLVSGYEPGNGARAHFGAMTLALIDENGLVVPAGRVGTGMTVKETHELKARLDNHEVLAVEIECLGVTSGSTLRMPVYCGIRSDVSILAASTSQLSTLPRS